MSSRRYEIGVGVLVLTGAGLLAFMALKVGALGSLGQHRLHATTPMGNVAGLSEGAVVAIAGVPVGTVEAMRVEDDHAVVTLSLDADQGIRTDAIVVMRARSVLGEKYLEIEPQSKDAPLLTDGGTLPHSQGAVEIDQLVTRMAPLLDAVDPAALREVVAALADAVREDPQRPARMLGDAEHALHNLALASDDIAPTVGDARATLASVKKTSDAARPVLAHVDSAVDRLDDLVASVPPERLPQLLDEIAATVRDGHAVIVKLDASTGQVQEILSKVNQIDRSDLLRITQEEGVLIRLHPRRVEDVLAAEKGEDR